MKQICAKASSFSTVALMALFSQYLANIGTPVPSFKSDKGWHFGRIRAFNLFPVSTLLLLLTSLEALTWFDLKSVSGF